MLHIRKIRWMTQASIYEKHEGKIDFSRNSFFISDYVRYHLWKNILGATVSYILILGIWCVCSLEKIMNQIASLAFDQTLRQILLIYAVVLIAYIAVSIVLYAWQYRKSLQRMRKYYRMLKLIEKYGQEEEK